MPIEMKRNIRYVKKIGTENGWKSEIYKTKPSKKFAKKKKEKKEEMSCGKWKNSYILKEGICTAGRKKQMVKNR